MEYKRHSRNGYKVSTGRTSSLSLFGILAEIVSRRYVMSVSTSLGRTRLLVRDGFHHGMTGRFLRLNLTVSHRTYTFTLWRPEKLLRRVLTSRRNYAIASVTPQFLLFEMPET